MYVCMYVCVYVYIYIYIYIGFDIFPYFLKKGWVFSATGGAWGRRVLGLNVRPGSELLAQGLPRKQAEGFGV